MRAGNAADADIIYKPELCVSSASNSLSLEMQELKVYY
jgi:hypothetical protein